MKADRLELTDLGFVLTGARGGGEGRGKYGVPYKVATKTAKFNNISLGCEVNPFSHIIVCDDAQAVASEEARRCHISEPTPVLAPPVPRPVGLAINPCVTKSPVK